MRALCIAAAACGLVAAPASAAELFGGVYAHDQMTFLNRGGFESGADVLVGIRGSRIDALGFIGAPAPYAFGSIATSGGTDLAAAGLGWKFGRRIYVRPGIGLAIHTRSSNGVRAGFRTDLGSRILFEPELGIGFQVSDRLSAEASWIHVSNAGILSRQNPGQDNIGVRLNLKLGK